MTRLADTRLNCCKLSLDDPLQPFAGKRISIPILMRGTKMWDPETDVFVCKCGLEVKPDENIEGTTGLLKPLHNQVELESFQATEIAKLTGADKGARADWISKHFKSGYPTDGDIEELILEFLYFSHRDDGCTATFECPECGRLALLHDVNEEWRFYKPESD